MRYELREIVEDGSTNGAAEVKQIAESREDARYHVAEILAEMHADEMVAFGDAVLAELD